MTSDKGKTIENYVILDKMFVKQDKSEFFSAQHRILKKIFTLRKVNLKQTPDLTSKNSHKADPEQLQQWLHHQVDLLRRLNGVSSPRCHKLIKTSNHIYVVYDEFPSRNLKQFLQKNILTWSEKLQLMLSIAETLKPIHKSGIVLNSLTLESIRVHQNKEVVFCDFSLGCLKDRSQRVNGKVLGLYEVEKLPSEVIEGGKCDFSTDVFMLGKVFEQLATHQIKSQLPKYRLIHQVVENMISRKPEDRFSLLEVIMELEIEKKQAAMEPKHTQNDSPLTLLAPPVLFNDLKPRKYSMDQSNKERDVSIVPKQVLTVKKMTSDHANVPDSPVPYKKNYSINSGSTKPLTTFTSVNNLTVKCPSITTNRSRSQRSFACDPKDADKSRKVNKERNLAFFILGLSEFVIEEGKSPELAYLLIKYANLTLKVCLEEFQTENKLSPELKQFKDMVVGEKLKISVTQARMRDILLKENIEPCFRRELEQQNLISDRYLKRKILEFGQEMWEQLERPSEGKRTVAQSTGILFKVYMLLKKVEAGSYQRFWQSIYNGNYANLGSQRYMRDEKSLGFRYLKSKVQAILS